MSKRLQHLGGTTTENDNYTGLIRELTVDTIKSTIRVHDGTTPGGTELARMEDIPAAVTSHTELDDRTSADSHPVSAITGLQSSLDSKASTVHTHELADIATTATEGQVVTRIGSSWAAADLPAVDFSNALPALGEVTHDLSGFPNRTDTILSFDSITRTVTLSAANSNAGFYHLGTWVPITTPLSLVWSDTDGGRYITYDANTEQLIEYGEAPDIRSGQVLVAYMYWNVAMAYAVIGGDERHGSARDTQWHYTQHRDVGAVWRSGGNLSFTLNDDSAVTIGVATPMIFADEDLEHTILHSDTPSEFYQQILDPVARIPVVAYVGSVYAEFPPVTDIPWKPGVSRAEYNPVVANVGSIAVMPDDRYLNYWMLATNDQAYPIKLLMGRVAHEDLVAASAEEVSSYGIPFAEMAIMYRIVLHVSDAYTGNAARVAIVEVTRASRSITAGSAAIAADSHELLAGRSLPDSHPLSAITGLQEALDSKAVPVYISDTPPSPGTPSRLWWDSASGNMFIYYPDGNSNQWVPTNAGLRGERGFGISETYYDLGNISGTVAVTFDFSDTQLGTITGNTTFNLPDLGGTNTRQLTIIVTNSTGGHAISVPGIKWVRGVAPTFDNNAGATNILLLRGYGSQWIGDGGVVA